MSRKINLVVLVLVVLGVTVCLGLVSKPSMLSTFSQPQYSIMVNMKKYPAWMEIPVQITEIKVQSKRVELDLPFQHSEDWLRDFSVVVKNTSDRPVLGLSLFLEWATDPTDDMPYIPETLLYAGQQFMLGSEATGKKLFLNLGESVELFVEKSWWDTHNNHIAGTAHELHKQIPETIRRKATLKYSYAGFDADTIWIEGSYSHRDPNNKDRFIPDDTQRKKISQILRQYKEDARVIYASYAPNRRSPGCEKTSWVFLQDCTLTNCPNYPQGACAVSKVQTEDASPGWKRKNVSRECNRSVNQQILACGCCQTTVEMNYDSPCT